MLMMLLKTFEEGQIPLVLVMSAKSGRKTSFGFSRDDNFHAAINYLLFEQAVDPRCCFIVVCRSYIFVIHLLTCVYGKLYYCLYLFIDFSAGGF